MSHQEIEDDFGHVEQLMDDYKQTIAQVERVNKKLHSNLNQTKLQLEDFSKLLS